MKAIITAAGYGSRMYPMAQDTPKCLLTIKGETLLDKHLRILKDCGVEDITVVTGFHQEKIVEQYGERVSIRYNPHYEITGSIFSLWVAREVLTDDVVVMNSDVVYTEEPVGTLLECKGDYCLLVDEKPCDDEDRKVKIVGNYVVGVSKALPAEETFGEFMYISLVRRRGLDAFKQSLFECVKRDSHLGWPDVFPDLINKGHKVSFVVTKGLWTEIDTAEDYKRAKQLFG